LNITNNGQGGLNIDAASVVKNGGLLYVTNTAGDLNMAGTVTNDGDKTQVYNKGGKAVISGTVNNANDLVVQNDGTGSLETTANITNGNDTTITNNGDGLVVSGNINNERNLVITSNNGGLTTNGIIENGGVTNVINNNVNDTTPADLIMTGTLKNDGNLVIRNGANTADMNLGGEIVNGGNAEVTNAGQMLNLQGNIENSGDMNILNNGAGMKSTEDSEILNGGLLYMTNNAGDLNLNGSIGNIGDKTQIFNRGGEANVSGKIENVKDLVIANEGTGALNVDAEVVNGNHTAISNRGTDLTVGGSIANDGNLIITNEGTGSTELNGTVDNKGITNVVNGTEAKNLTLKGKLNNLKNLVIRNNGTGETLVAGEINNGQDTEITNNGSKLTFDGVVNNEVGLKITNNGTEGLTMTENSDITNLDGLEITNNKGDLNMSGTVANGNWTSITNAEGNAVVNGKIENAKSLKITNNGEGELAVGADVTNGGNTLITNKGSDLTISGNINNEGNIIARNDGTGAVTMSGNIENKGTTNLINSENGTDLTMNGTINNDKNLVIRNHGTGATIVSGDITNGENAEIRNDGTGLNVTETSEIKNGGMIYINNTKGDVVVDGQVTSGDVSIQNIGNGVIINDDANVTSTTGNVEVYSHGSEDVQVRGHIKSANDISVNAHHNNIVIGSENASSVNNLDAVNNVDLYAYDGNILNAGTQNTIVKAGGDFTAKTIDGTIGENVTVGVDPTSRDLTKSINIDVDGTVTANTLRTSAEDTNNYVINIASKDSDMNINQINALGDVLLLAGETTDTSASILNAAQDDAVANVQGRGISIIASNEIGSADKPLTFNQTDTRNEVNLLSIKDMNVKGLDDAYDTNAGTVISREGTANIEFSGNAVVKEVTAAKDINMTTRGAALQIKTLGSVPATPVDFYGENADITPENATIKALDINTRTRVDNTMIDGVNHWADSRVVINDGRLQDGGNLNVVADRVYANGVQVHFNKDGYSKIANGATNEFEGEDLNLVGSAVRPDDVTEIGHEQNERNYYYHAGDGDFTDGSTNVDSDNGVIDATPLKIEPTRQGGTNPNPQTQNPNNDTTQMAYSAYKQRTVENTTNATDKRQTMRFNVNESGVPVSLGANDMVDSVVDISRGGIAVTHHNTLKVGDVVPVHLTYGNIDVRANVKIVSATRDRAGAEFVNLDEATANNILYMNILLEETMAAQARSFRQQADMPNIR